jgi:FAD/FMN-containing dehydrogenase
VDLGAKGSCCIGGNVASNAGGQYYYRYGSIAANLLGLQVVLANGNVLDLNYETRTNLKDNSGYKLHQLFVGSEGTLGVITGVALHCPKLAASRQAAFLACRSFESVLKVMEKAKQDLGEILVAAEWMDQAVVGILGQHSYSIPLKANYHSMHFLLVETHGCNVDHDREKLETFLELLFVSEHIDDGVVAQDVSQVMAFWKIRESANPVVMSTGYTYKFRLVAKAFTDSKYTVPTIFYHEKQKLNRSRNEWAQGVLESALMRRYGTSLGRDWLLGAYSQEERPRSVAIILDEATDIDLVEGLLANIRTVRTAYR